MKMANHLQIVVITTLALYCAFDRCKALSTGVGKNKPVLYAPEKALARDLLAQYAKVGDPLNGRPVERANETVVVTVGLTLMSIVDVNEQGIRPTITINCWIDHLWKDPFLKWDSSENGGVSSIQIFVKDIWTPDDVFRTTRGNIDMFDERSKAMVYSNGEIFWSPVRTLTFDCEPVDQNTLKCSTKLESMTTTSDKVLFRNKSDSLELASYVSNPNWVIVNTQVRMVDVKYACCEETYNHLLFELEVKRRREMKSKLESSSASTAPVYYFSANIMSNMIFIAWILRP